MDARRWPIRAPSCPGVQADDHRIQAARAGAVPLGYPPRPRASLPGTVGATGLEGPHLRGRRSLPHSRFLVLGRADGADPALPTIPDDRSVQRPARVPGPLFERSGQQATGPSDHRPRPNRSARTSRPTPHRNATAPPHPRPPTRAITSSVITYRSFQIKGVHRQLNTPRASRRGGRRAGCAYLHSVIDGFSHLAPAKALDDERATTAIAFFARARAFFEANGIGRITRLVTDNGSVHCSTAFNDAVRDLVGRRQCTRPYRRGTAAKSSATTGSWPRSSSTPVHSPARNSEETNWVNGPPTTITTDPTPPWRATHPPAAPPPPQATSHFHTTRARGPRWTR